MQDKQGAPRRFLRLPEVMARTGLAKTTIYERIDRGEFPKQLPIGGRLVAWRESDIEAWMDNPIGETSNAA